MNPFIPKATTNAAGNWFVRKVPEIASSANFQAMVVRTIFLKQSFLLFSCISTQVARGTDQKFTLK